MYMLHEILLKANQSKTEAISNNKVVVTLTYIDSWMNTHSVKMMIVSSP